MRVGEDLEVGIWKWEVGPVVVPKGWDYAAASMRKAEKKKVGSCEGEKVGEKTGLRYLNSEVGKWNKVEG